MRMESFFAFKMGVFYFSDMTQVISEVEKMIFHLRGMKIMIDSDLAELYGIETRILIQAVKRNIERFPEDFMFECTLNELADLRSQIVIANRANYWNHKRRGSILVFTENGVAMLSSVLSSSTAIQINIGIMRAFTRMRNALPSNDRILKKIDSLEKGTSRIFEAVFERLNHLENGLPALRPGRRKIGLKKT